MARQTPPAQKVTNAAAKPPVRRTRAASVSVAEKPVPASVTPDAARIAAYVKAGLTAAEAVATVRAEMAADTDTDTSGVVTVDATDADTSVVDSREFVRPDGSVGVMRKVGDPMAYGQYAAIGRVLSLHAHDALNAILGDTFGVSLPDDATKGEAGSVIEEIVSQIGGRIPWSQNASDTPVPSGRRARPKSRARRIGR